MTDELEAAKNQLRDDDPGDAVIRTLPKSSQDHWLAVRLVLDALKEAQGCGSHSCIIKKPKGQGVNGPCKCRKARREEER